MNAGEGEVAGHELLGLVKVETAPAHLQPDFFLQPPKSGFNTVRLEQVGTHCFSRQAYGATLGRILRK